MGWKYIVLRRGNQEVPFIFPEDLVHSMVADAMKNCLAAEAFEVMPRALQTVGEFAKLRDAIKPVSAGRILIRPQVIMDSRSETLNLKPRVGDIDMMIRYPYQHGILPEEGDGG